MPNKTPDWVKNAIFYQIFPDRFARSSRSISLPGIQFKPWGSPPDEQGYQGGNLLGIVDKLDYLKELGITAIYLNPIFSSASNHRYHTYDYYQVDPLLGGNSALRELLNEAHSRNIKIVLDGVFNHTGRGFWAFHHILENGKNSPYLDWYNVKSWPLHPYGSAKKSKHNYEAWWNLPALPKLNIKNPGVRKYLLDVAKYWIDFGIDGWRLDVPDEIKDKKFWQLFRKVVKEANPEAYLCGEIWRLAPEWLKGDRFDALMNYQFGVAVINFFGAEKLKKYRKGSELVIKPIGVHKFSKTICSIYNAYDWDVNFAQLNLFDSHDTPRMLWLLNGDKTNFKLCVLFQMTMPGAPCIYYGDEIGMTGADDPYCRKAFPWDKKEVWDTQLLSFYHLATSLRHRYPALRTGEFYPLFAGKGLYAFGRSLGNQKIIAIFNAKPKETNIKLDVNSFAGKATSFLPIWGKASKLTVQNGFLERISIPSKGALIFVSGECKI